MQKLALHYDQLLKGRFELSNLNLLFVFQVNCPGCFAYAIPMVSKLYQAYNHHISFLGLSTAFEDFELNTPSNTQALLKRGQVIGETKKMLLQHNFDHYPYPIEFPVALDAKADQSFDFNRVTQQICELNPNYSIWSKFDQQTLATNVLNYLMSLECISMTFTINQLRGTPSFLLFNKEYEILYNQFGHVDSFEIEQQINKHSCKTD